jgi:Uma2 family endonuclease
MTLAAERTRRLIDQQHIVLHDVSWDFYERVLAEVGDQPIRVTFSDGSIEIMSPLPEHEWIKKAIASLIDLMVVELNIAMSAFGSSTFRREDKQKGLEPDECYFLKNASRVRGMKQFDPAIHPAPDLAIEVDVTTRSIARQPIYAALGVPEIWRFDGQEIHVLLLRSDGKYSQASASAAFPFLPMDHFLRFALRIENEERTAVLREFQQWVRTLKSD